MPVHTVNTRFCEFEEFLKPLDVTQRDLAKRLGVSYPRINEIIHGRRGVTPDTALRLERLFGIEGAAAIRAARWRFAAAG